MHGIPECPPHDTIQVLFEPHTNELHPGAPDPTQQVPEAQAPPAHKVYCCPAVTRILTYVYSPEPPGGENPQHPPH